MNETTAGPMRFLVRLVKVRPGVVIDWLRRGAAAFTNYPSLFGRCLVGYLGLAKSDIVFRTRTGLTLKCPGSPPEPWPIFEVFAFDAYRLSSVAFSPDATGTVIDVGAHIGSFALECARRFPACHIVCFEPNPKSFRYLKTNVGLNHLDGRIRCRMTAVGPSNGTAGLFESGPESTLIPKMQTDAVELRRVQVLSFEDALRDASPGSIDLLKLDCEGFEYPIILDAPAAAWKTVQRVLLEYHAVPGRTWSSLQRQLIHLGFRMAWHRPDARGTIGTAYFTRDALPATEGETGQELEP